MARPPRSSATTARSLNSAPLGADELLRFVSLARDEHDVAGARALDRGLQRRAAVVDHADARVVAETRANVGDDRAGILAARVVVGQHDAVGEVRGDGAHHRPLAAVAIAAAAEHAPELAGDGAFERRQHALQRIRRVRIVDDDPRLGRRTAEHFHAARRRLRRAERGARRRQRHALREQRAERRRAGSPR